MTKEASLGDIISVRTESAEPLSFYRAMGLEVNLRDHVIVETDRGVEYGQVVGFTDDSNPKVVEPVRSIIRIATEEDEQRNELNIDNESKFFDICEGKINEHGLNMKLVRVKCLFDGNKIIFYFAAETRVDFRSLVKDLASIFKTRIELRQIGSRDEARLVGGLEYADVIYAVQRLYLSLHLCPLKWLRSRTFLSHRQPFQVYAADLCAVSHMRIQHIWI